MSDPLFDHLIVRLPVFGKESNRSARWQSI